MCGSLMSAHAYIVGQDPRNTLTTTNGIVTKSFDCEQ